MACLPFAALLVALALLVVIVGVLLRALPVILIAAGVVLLLRWYLTEQERATPQPTNVRPRDQARPGSANPPGTGSGIPAWTPTGDTTRRQFLVRYQPDAVHDAIEESLNSIGAKLRWDRSNPQHIGGVVKRGGLLGTKRHIDVTFGHLGQAGSWVSIMSDSVELQARFEQALNELIGPSRELVDEYEAAWCGRFNAAMARQGDPARSYPGRWICPSCGTANAGTPSCSHCGAESWPSA